MRDGVVDSDDGGDAAVPACTTPAIADDFTSATESTEWNVYTDTGVTVTRTGGQLVITLAANTGGSRYGGYVTIPSFDIREHCMYITIISPPSQAGGTEVKFTLQNGVNYTGYSVASNHLEAFNVMSGTPTSLSMVPYDPAKPLTLRLRETGGMTHYEHSTDGVTFIEQIALSDQIAMNAVAPLFDAGTFASTPNPGTAVFDNFDLP